MSKQDNSEAQSIGSIDPLDRIYVRALPDNTVQSTDLLKENALITPRQLIDDIEEHMALLFIQQNVEDFEKSEFKDPWPALSAFIRSVEYGVYPPQSVLVWLANAFKKFQNEQGCASLEEVFGFEAGKHNPYLRDTVDGVKLEAVMEKAILVCLMGLASGDADVIIGKKFSLRGEPRNPEMISLWVEEKQSEYDEFVKYFLSREEEKKVEIIEATLGRLSLYDSNNAMLAALEAGAESSS